jgi:hypothetical protein
VSKVDEADLTQAVWRKSGRRSGSGQWVEVAYLDQAVAVRDSKNRKGLVLVFTPDEWSAFIGGVLDGDFPS